MMPFLSNFKNSLLAGFAFLLIPFTIFAQAPTTPASNLNGTSNNGSTINLSWTNGNGSNRLVVASLNPITATPTNGIDYTASTNFGSGGTIAPGVFVIGKPTGSTQIVNNLTPLTPHYFAVYEFNGSGANTNYLVTNPASGQFSPISAPTVQASNIQFTNITGNSMRITLTRGNGDRVLVVMKAGSPISNTPPNLTSYTASVSFGSGSQIVPNSGEFVVANSTGAVNINMVNLQPNTTYHIAAFEYNGSSNPIYLTPGVVANQATSLRPTLAATNITFNNLQGNSMLVGLAPGNGARRLVLARANGPVNGVPTDGVDYNAGAFGAADQIGTGNFVVGKGNSSSFNVTGLSANTQYHFAIYEFDGTGAATAYQLVPPLVGAQITLGAPTNQPTALLFSAVTGTSMSITWTNGNGTRRMVAIRAGSPVTSTPTDFISPSTSSNFVSAPALGDGSKVVYLSTGSTVNVSNLSPAITYHVAIFEANGSGSGIVYNQQNPLIGSQSTVGAPTQSVTNLLNSFVSGNAANFTMTAGDGAGRMLVLRDSLAVDFVPNNGTSYTANANFGNGTVLGNGNVVIGNIGSTNGNVSGLLPRKTYHLAVFEYNGIGNDRLYNLNPTRISFSTLDSPTISASNVQFTNVTGNSATINWTNGNGEGRILFLKAGSPIINFPPDLEFYNTNTTFGSGTAMPDGSRAIYAGPANNSIVTNLQAGTTYYAAVFEYNGNSSGRVYKRSAGVATMLISGGPTQAASNLNFQSVSATSMFLNFTAGNGSRRIVVARAIDTVNFQPVNGVDYTAASNFSTGTDLGGGQKVVFNGTGSSVTVTGLLPSTGYYFKIFELNGTGANIEYQIPPPLAGFSSTAVAPTQQVSNIAFQNITGTGMQVSLTVGNGERRMVICKAGSPVDTFPTNGASYAPSTNFGFSSSAMGNGNFVVYQGTGNVFTLSNLQPGTVYHFAAFEANGTSNFTYLTPGITASQVTAGAPLVSASNWNLASVQGNGITYTFTQGDGSGRMIVLRENAPVIGTPQNGTTYSANANFGNGDSIGLGSFVVGSTTLGSGSVANLKPATTYHFAVIEFNGTGTSRIYQQSNFYTGTFNTLNAPTLQVSALQVNNISLRTASITWTNGNGDGQLVVMRKNLPVDFVPQNITNYSSNPQFGSTFTALGNGNFAVYNSTGTSVNITGLDSNSTYHIAIFERNGSTSGAVYNTSAITDSFSTLQSLSINLLPGLANTFCQGSFFNLSFVIPGFFEPGNIFRAELSDINGSFASSTLLTSVNAVNIENIYVGLPSGLTPGTGYRLRVVSTQPAIASNNNGVDLTIANGTIVNISIASNASANFCQGDTVVLSTTPNSALNFQWYSDNQILVGETSSSLNATSSGFYQLRASNSAGCNTFSNAIGLSQINAPIANVTGTSNELCSANAQVTLSANITGASNLRWFRNGVEIPGATQGTLLVNQAGNYQVRTGVAPCVQLSNTFTVTRTFISSNLSISICAGDSYQFAGAQLTSAGIYTDTIVTSGNCDTLVTLTLAVNQSSTNNLNVSICQGQSYNFNGVSLTSAGTYSDTLTNAGGCDSILTLNLVVNTSINNNINASICQGDAFLFGGIPRTIAGNYTDTLNSVGGCDSIVTLNLVVNSSSTNNINASICQGEGFLFGGISRTTAGNYADTLQNSVGCDSIITLNLTVNPTSFNSINASICQGDSYLFGGISRTTSGTYTDTLVNSVGCDSIVTLSLAVNPSSTNNLNVSICQGQTYVFNGVTLTSAGTYSDTLTNAAGCDSTINLNLQVVNVIQNNLSITQCIGNSYTFAGQQLTQAGMYSDTLISNGGCDSVVTLQLAFNSIATEIQGIDSVDINDVVSYQSANINASIYNWILPNGGVILSGQGTSNIQVEWQQLGNYILILEVEDSISCTASDTFNVTVSDVVSTRNNNLNSSWKVFPNPTKGIVYLQSMNSDLNTSRIWITDLNGRTVKDLVTVSAEIYEINIQELPQGMYLLHWNVKGNVLHQKIMKF